MEYILIATIQNVITKQTYEREFDGDFEKLQNEIGKDYIIKNCNVRKVK